MEELQRQLPGVRGWLRDEPVFAKREGLMRGMDRGVTSSSLILLSLTLYSFLCDCLPLTSLSLTQNPHRRLDLSRLNKPAFAMGHEPVANVFALT